MARTEAQRRGDRAESIVAEHFRAAGWRVLGRQVRLGRAEVDIVAVDPGPPPRLVIVEVRWRASRAFGLPEETFDWRKRGHLRVAAGRLASMRTLPDGTSLPRLPIGVDLVVVEPPLSCDSEIRLRHHRDALGG